MVRPTPETQAGPIVSLNWVEIISSPPSCAYTPARTLERIARIYAVRRDAVYAPSGTGKYYECSGLPICRTCLHYLQCVHYLQAHIHADAHNDEDLRRSGFRPTE